MGELKQIMYGVTDFALMRRENAYFVDRTELIRELEKQRYVMFLRPRRFGKSLFCAILKSYYDIDYADQFEELFGGLDIGRNPTREHNQYLVLDFNFSIIEKAFSRVQDSFNSYCCKRIDQFVRNYAAYLPEGTRESVSVQPDCHRKLQDLFVRMSGSKVKLYVIIDEYDNFTNTILSESKDNYEALCHGEGFFKQFFNEFKGLATGVDSPVARMFITGVTPVTMDDVTSGFNIAANISLRPEFAGLVGFSHADLRQMLAYYHANVGFDFDEDAIFEMLRQWYDNYRFSQERLPDGSLPDAVANPTLVLYFMWDFLMSHRPPRDLVDENLRTDYMKIRHIITEGNRINGNYHRLEDLIARLGTTATLRRSFQARELGTSDNFVSFLFYNGLVSITDETFGQAKLGIPNQTVGEFLHDFVGRAYDAVYGVDSRVFDIANGMTDFARTGDAHKALDTACGVVSQYWRVRDAAEGERVVQTALCSLLYVGHGPYVVRHELEENGGFVDIALEPQLSCWPQIGHAALIELKYFKAEDKLSKQKLASLKRKAREQLDQYAADHDLARSWCLVPGAGCLVPAAEIQNAPGTKHQAPSTFFSSPHQAPGTKHQAPPSPHQAPSTKHQAPLPSVTLHRFAIIFHGGDCVCCAEL